MKIKLFVFILFTLVSVNSFASKCPSIPDSLKKAITAQAKELRAAEYCESHIVRTVDKNTFVIFTTEGACEDDKSSKAGTCGNGYERYMTAFVNGHLIKPILIGGKEDFSDESMSVTGDIIELKGLSMGPDDSFCCPSIPTVKKYKFSSSSFVEIK